MRNCLSGFLTPTPPILRVLNSFFHIPWAHGTTRYMLQNGHFGGVFLVCQVMLTIHLGQPLPVYLGQPVPMHLGQPLPVYFGQLLPMHLGQPLSMVN